MIKRVSKFCKSYLVIVCIAVLLVFMAIFYPSYFSFSTFKGLLIQISVYGIVACAMTIAIIGGEFDLSVGSILPFSTLLFAYLMPRIGIFASIVLILITGGVIGAVNGFFVSVLKLNAFIVTLSTMLAVEGIMLTFCNGMPIPAVNQATRAFGTGNIGGIAYIAILFFICVLITHYVLTKTAFGRNVFATGGNYNVAEYAGIGVKKIKFLLFVILGFASAFAGVLLTCRLQAGSPLYGSDVSMSVVSATVLGGTSLSGGRGSVFRTFLGMIFIGMLSQIFTHINAYAYLQQLIQGAVVVAIVILDAWNNRKREDELAGI